jgi:ribonuclease BN (tRNA processing enzyme)
MMRFCLAVALAGIAGAVAAAVQGGPQAAETRPVLAGTHIVTLGTAGGPMPRRDRAQSSNLLVVDGRLYLIDAGDGVTRRIVQAGYDFRQIGRIFLTHLHGDHTAGLANLLEVQWELARREPVDIYGSGVEELLRGALAYLTPNSEIRWVEGKRTPPAAIFNAREVTPGVVYQDDKIKVIAIENTHFHFPPGSRPDGRFRSYSYRFETPDRVVVFAGDTGPSAALTELAKDADVLVTEAVVPADVIGLYKRNGIWEAKTEEEREGFVRTMEGEHLTPRGVGETAAKAGVKRIVMTHFPPTDDPEDDYRRYIDQAREFYAGPISIAKDLMEF